MLYDVHRIKKDYSSISNAAKDARKNQQRAGDKKTEVDGLRWKLSE